MMCTSKLHVSVLWLLGMQMQMVSDVGAIPIAMPVLNVQLN